MVFIMGPQLRLTGPSLNGISTELKEMSNTIQHSGTRHSLQPVLHIVKLRAWYRVDVQGRLREVFKYQDHVKLLQPELDTLQGCNLDVGESHNKEWRVRQMNKTFGRRLQANISPEGDTFERKFAERNIRL